MIALPPKREPRVRLKKYSRALHEPKHVSQAAPCEAGAGLYSSAKMCRGLIYAVTDVYTREEDEQRAAGEADPRVTGK